MEERFLDQEFQTITEDIITHPLFLQLRQLQHHGGENNLYDHSVDTAACAYRMARRFHMREDRVRAVTRAALLHDFCGYDWRGSTYKRFISGYSGLHRLKRMHAFIHGPLAARRAQRLFDLDERQCAAIACHMFPLAHMPRNSEAWVLTLADKWVASREVSGAAVWYIRSWCRKAVPAR